MVLTFLSCFLLREYYHLYDNKINKSDYKNIKVKIHNI